MRRRVADMHKLRTRPAIIVSALVFTLLAAACGGGKSSNGEEKKAATQVFADAKAAVLQASSFHVSGQTGEGTAALSLDVSLSSTRGGGRITVQGATLQLVASGRELYLKADANSWQKLSVKPAASQLLANRWIKVPTTNADFSELAALLDSSKFMKNLTAEGRVTKHAVTKIDGNRAIPLVDSRGGTLYVAATGPAYILKIVDTGKSSGGPGTVTFDHYGDATVPPVPTGAVDFGTLIKG
jgi:hypothetical protein